jgi:hypothetical protein
MIVSVVPELSGVLSIQSGGTHSSVEFASVQCCRTRRGSLPRWPGYEAGYAARWKSVAERSVRTSGCAPRGELGELHQKLLDAGIENHTSEPTEGGARVHGQA